MNERRLFVSLLLLSSIVNIIHFMYSHYNLLPVRTLRITEGMKVPFNDSGKTGGVLRVSISPNIVQPSPPGGKNKRTKQKLIKLIKNKRQSHRLETYYRFYNEMGRAGSDLQMWVDLIILHRIFILCHCILWILPFVFLIWARLEKLLRTVRDKKCRDDISSWSSRARQIHGNMSHSRPIK